MADGLKTYRKIWGHKQWRGEPGMEPERFIYRDPLYEMKAWARANPQKMTEERRRKITELQQEYWRIERNILEYTSDGATFCYGSNYYTCQEWDTSPDVLRAVLERLCEDRILDYDCFLAEHVGREDWWNFYCRKKEISLDEITPKTNPGGRREDISGEERDSAPGGPAVNASSGPPESAVQWLLEEWGDEEPSYHSEG